jgi:hypothetical protein
MSRDNVTTLYGFDATSRIADPRDPTKVFTWQICRSWDDKGNVALYTYVHEDGAGIKYSTGARSKPKRARQSDVFKEVPVREPVALFSGLDGRNGVGAPERLDVQRCPGLRRPYRFAADA